MWNVCVLFGIIQQGEGINDAEERGLNCRHPLLSVVGADGTQPKRQDHWEVGAETLTHQLSEVLHTDTVAGIQLLLNELLLFSQTRSQIISWRKKEEGHCNSEEREGVKQTPLEARTPALT